MKKTFAVFAAIVLLFASGCQKADKVPDAPPSTPTNFSSDLTAVFGDIEMTAAFEKNSAWGFVLDILTPEILEPLKFIYSDGKCTAEYDGLTFEADLARFPQSEFGSLLTNALSAVYDGMDIAVTYSDGVWKYNGTGERGAFTLTQSESGEWLEFSVDAASLKAVFGNFRAQ